MVAEYKNFIEAICDKFRNEVTPLDVVAWLENFDQLDWKKALILLNAFEYYDEANIIREFEIGLREILESSPQNKKIVVVAVDKIGKSGAAMVYYLKKTPSFIANKIQILHEPEFDTINNNYIVVLVDDFSGTGGTIINFYNLLFGNVTLSSNVFALTISFLEKAKVALDTHGIKIVGNERNAAFAARGSVFGYYPRMVAIREFCFKYGNEIYPEVKYKRDPKNIHPLGYLNSQALVGFSHSIPNNTVPILWANNKRLGGKKWVPLFPRRGNVIIERVEEFKNQQRYWASIFYKLDLNQDWTDLDKKYGRDSVQLLSIIFLKRKGKNVLNICQLLGINIPDYNKIINYGLSKSIFDQDENLTDQAIRIVDEIKKRIKFERYNSKILKIEEDVLYIPKIFRGSP